MLAQLRRLFVAWWTYHDTVWRLDLLDDRLLADTGIGRKDIRVRARRAAFHRTGAGQPGRAARSTAPAARVPVIRRDRPARIS